MFKSEFKLEILLYLKCCQIGNFVKKKTWKFSKILLKASNYEKIKKMG